MKNFCGACKKLEWVIILAYCLKVNNITGTVQNRKIKTVSALESLQAKATKHYFPLKEKKVKGPLCQKACRLHAKAYPTNKALWPLCYGHPQFTVESLGAARLRYIFRVGH